jgi:regulator of protease activity HflC (stomatin/prohibitin superfamily)
MVDFDLSMSFRIGPGPDEATSFVYKLGADRFDELAAAEMEETVRSLAYSTTHDKVDDLREEFSVGLLSALNPKFRIYGVQVVAVKITGVALPADIRDRLERITALKTDLSEREKIHKKRIRELEDEAVRSIEVTRMSNERRLREIEAERIRYAIERRVMEEAARGRARVEEMKAMADADVALKRSLGNETVEKVLARQQAEALIKKAHIQCQTMRIEAEKNVNIEVKNSEAELAVAESKAVRFILWLAISMFA